MSVVTPKRPFDPLAARADFPILHTEARGKPLVYLDNAATTQKPNAVIETIDRYYRQQNANVHRGVHYLSEVSTERYESARQTVAGFINAGSDREVIFTRGTTEAINLVAAGFGQAILQPGDEVLVTTMEHHSNIVPWQLACERSGATLVVTEMDDRGTLLLDDLIGKLNERTRLVAMVHVSNALGSVNPVEAVVAAAHERGIPVLLDGAQSVAHLSVDVQALDVDFFAFSGHKLYGPTGIGVLYGKERWLDRLPPYQGGGDMIRQVSFSGTTYNELPFKFEAGTPNIAGTLGLAAAIDYLSQWDMAEIAAHEDALLQYACARAAEVPGMTLVGTSPKRVGVMSFMLEGAHPHDISTLIDFEGVAVRAGHHCAQPLMERLGVPATARASFALYNTTAEIDTLFAAIDKVRRLFL